LRFGFYCLERVLSFGFLVDNVSLMVSRELHLGDLYSPLSMPSLLYLHPNNIKAHLHT
jgi:hypothetical protein